MARKKGVHPLVSAATLVPLAIGLSGNLSNNATTERHPTHQVRTTTNQFVGGSFAPSCKLPFAAIQEHHPIDDSCPADGDSKTSTPQGKIQAAQNDAKNNFCSADASVNINFNVLQQLQTDASKSGSGITFGSDSQLPKDRTVLRNLTTPVGRLSEGMVVRIAAFVINAHASNLGKGESVNCNQPDAESNDIHIVLGQNSNHDDECSSVTAEMSPHFRPAIWTPSNLNEHNTHLYRFTGQLFFDASHRPCAGGKGSPARSSLWEIHPVYAVDICMDTNNNCKVDSDENWVSFSEEMGEDSSETHLFLPEDISREFGSARRSRKNE